MAVEACLYNIQVIGEAVSHLPVEVKEKGIANEGTSSEEDNDKKREKFFVDLSYTVKRFTNKQVQNDIEFILSEVNSFIESSRNILLNEKSSPPFREVLGGLL